MQASFIHYSSIFNIPVMVRHLPHMHSLKHPSRYPLWNHPGPENLTDLGICHLNLPNFLKFSFLQDSNSTKKMPLLWDELGSLFDQEKNWVLWSCWKSFPSLCWKALMLPLGPWPRIHPADCNWLNPNEMPQGCTYHNASQLKGISIPQWNGVNPVQPTDSFNFATFRIHVEKKPELSSRFLQPLGRHAR